MVTLNLTLFIQLGLFLVFLALMNRLVFRPLLKLMDERQRKLVQDTEDANKLALQARVIEQQYRARLNALHREASHKLQTAHRQAQEEHNLRIEKLRRNEMLELRKVHKDAEAQLTRERAHAPQIIDELVHAIAARVGVERHPS